MERQDQGNVPREKAGTSACEHEGMLTDPQSEHRERSSAGLVAGLHRNAAYRCRRTALASRPSPSGTFDNCPVAIQSCRGLKLREHSPQRSGTAFFAAAVVGG